MTDRGGVYHPVIELTLSRLREYSREPEAMFWLVAFPLLMAIALGIAFKSSADDPVRAGVQEGQGSAEVRAILDRTPGIRATTMPASSVDAALRDDAVQVVVIPGDPPAFRFDPSRPETRLARYAVDDALQRAAGRRDRFTAGEQRVEAVGSRYIDWLIPGLLGMNIMGTGLWSVGYSIVAARSRGLLKRLAATPMSRAQYLLGQMLARLVFLVVEVGVLLVSAALIFSVPVRGSWLLLAGVALLGAMAFNAVGVLVASRSRTIEAVSGWMNLVSVPMWVLSGVFFSAARFPAPAQPFIKALPLTALNDAFRGVMLDGAGLAAIGPEVAILTAWTFVCFAVALHVFRWR